MKVGLIATLLVIGVVAYFGYAYMAGPSYGISDDQPLGDFGELEAKMLTLGLEKVDIAEEDIPEEFEGLRGFRYWDRKQSEDNGGFKEYVNVYVDSKEHIHGIKAHWMQAPETSTMYTTRVMVLMIDYWPKVGGQSPVKFRERVEGTGNFGIAVKFNKFKTGKIYGHWERRRSPFPMEEMLYYSLN